MGRRRAPAPVSARTLAWPAAVAAVALLHGLAAWTSPPSVPLSEVPDHLGERVVVGGRLRDVQPLDGARLVEVTDGRVYLPALLRGTPDRPLEPGDEVTLAGVVGLHRGTHQVTGRAGDVTVHATRGTPLDPSTVAETPRRFVDTPIRVAGRLEGEAGAWRLADARARLPLEPQDGEALRAGIEVVAQGVLGYDPADARYVLEEASWRRR